MTLLDGDKNSEPGSSKRHGLRFANITERAACRIRLQCRDPALTGFAPEQVDCTVGEDDRGHAVCGYIHAGRLPVPILVHQCAIEIFPPGLRNARHLTEAHCHRCFALPGEQRNRVKLCRNRALRQDQYLLVFDIDGHGLRIARAIRINKPDLPDRNRAASGPHRLLDQVQGDMIAAACVIADVSHEQPRPALRFERCQVLPVDIGCVFQTHRSPVTAIGAERMQQRLCTAIVDDP